MLGCRALLPPRAWNHLVLETGGCSSTTSPRRENWTVTRQMAELSLRFWGVSSPSVNLYKQDWPHWGSARQVNGQGFIAPRAWREEWGKREKLNDLAKKALCGSLWLSQPGPSSAGVSAGGDSSSHSCQTKPGGLGQGFSWKVIFSPNPGKSKGWSGGGMRFPQSMATEESPWLESIIIIIIITTWCRDHCAPPSSVLLWELVVSHSPARTSGDLRAQRCHSALSEMFQ